MPKITKYAFILKAEGYNHENDRRTLETDGFNTKIVAVSSVDEACTVARKLVEEGVEIIELCGGFTVSNSEEIIEAINGSVPVGLVGFADKEADKLVKYTNL